jgi:hypothetical protein
MPTTDEQQHEHRHDRERNHSEESLRMNHATATVVTRPSTPNARGFAEYGPPCNTTLYAGQLVVGTL